MCFRKKKGKDEVVYYNTRAKQAAPEAVSYSTDHDGGYEEVKCKNYSIILKYP